MADSDGEWNQELAESYADRVIERLTLVIPDLPSLVLDRKVLSPRDIESLNMNLVGGDPYSGDFRLDQFFVWRPLSSSKNHETEVSGLIAHRRFHAPWSRFRRRLRIFSRKTTWRLAPPELHRCLADAFDRCGWHLAVYPMILRRKSAELCKSRARRDFSYVARVIRI